jgi:hypothetical protein
LNSTSKILALKKKRETRKEKLDGNQALNPLFLLSFLFSHFFSLSDRAWTSGEKKTRKEGRIGRRGR